MKRDMMKHEFVEFIPSDLDEGVLYISMPFATAAHNCCCGCGNRVVTPLTPTDWKLTYNGESVWLDPSIGNWSFPCQSHYWIKRSKVSWANQWSSEKIAAGRERDKLMKQRQFEPIKALPAITTTSVTPMPIKNPPVGFWNGFWRRLKVWLGNK